MLTPVTHSVVARRALAPALVAEFERQNQALGSSRQRDTHLAQLSRSDLGVVVTGQQVGLFLGPAYSLYKAATTVVLARRITAQSGLPTVPVFWLQSEDHDAAEVQTANVLDEHDNMVGVRLEVSGTERSSMAARQLGNGVSAALAQLREQLSAGDHCDDTLRLLERCYTSQHSWVQAFAQALGELFANEGLLLLDPRTANVAELARPVHRRAIDDSAAIDAALERGAAALTNGGEPVMVPPRPGCTLSFYHPAGPAGPRHRLTRHSNSFEIPTMGKRLTHAELVAELQRAPLHFSTSALLRVVLQNTLLPTLAQVAGPGEARYLKQLPPLYNLFGVTPAAVVPRARFVVTSNRCRRRLDALGISATALNDEHALLHALAQGDAGPKGDEVVARLMQAIDPILNDLAPDLVAIDPALDKAALRTRRHVLRGVAGLGKRIDSARAQKDSTRVARVRYLTRRLLPGGAPQERVLAFPHFAARFGVAALKSSMFNAIEEHLEHVDKNMPRLQELAL